MENRDQNRRGMSCHCAFRVIVVHVENFSQRELPKIAYSLPTAPNCSCAAPSGFSCKTKAQTRRKQQQHKDTVTSQPTPSDHSTSDPRDKQWFCPAGLAATACPSLSGKDAAVRLQARSINATPAATTSGAARSCLPLRRKQSV